MLRERCNQNPGGLWPGETRGRRHIGPTTLVAGEVVSIGVSAAALASVVGCFVYIVWSDRRSRRSSRKP